MQELNGSTTNVVGLSLGDDAICTQCDDLVFRSAKD